MMVPVSSTGETAEVTLLEEKEESAGAAVSRDIKVKGWSVTETKEVKAAASAILEDGDKKIIAEIGLAASGSTTQFVPQPGAGGQDEFINAKGKLVLKRTGSCTVVVYTDQ